MGAVLWSCKPVLGVVVMAMQWTILIEVEKG